MLRKCAPKQSIGLHRSIFPYNQKKREKNLTILKYWYLKIRNYTIYMQRQLDYFEPKAQETLNKGVHLVLKK